MAQTAVATGATAVGVREATFHGAVNPDGIESDAWFEYGLTTSYGSKTSLIDVGSGSSDVPISATITNLQPEHEYHYRAVIDPTAAPPVPPSGGPPAQPGGSGNPQPPASGATGATKPKYAWKLTPGYYASQDGPAANYQACWLGAQNGTYVIDRLAGDTIYLAFMFNIASAWVAANQGHWGRMINFHNTSLEPAQAGWATAPGNSALAIDYYNNDLTVNTEPDNSPNNYTIQAALSKNVTHTLACKFVLGRTSGTPNTGAVRIALDGTDKVNVSGINTLWNFSGNIQRYMWLWAGFYTQGISDGQALECTMNYPWIGTTPAGALARTIGGEGGSWALSDIPIPGRNHSLGPATCTALTPANASDLVLPAWFV